MIRIAIVDDRDLVRAGIRAILEQELPGSRARVRGTRRLSDGLKPLRLWRLPALARTG